tara:strand:- start:597 stop:1562 length:966 start_codon:yes stop_codon:yes gene_type:complete
MKKILLLVILTLVCLSCRQQKIMKVAHRGASGYLPEHTLEAVAMAHSWDIDYIEPDLVMTKDNQLIVMHDPHLDTTTNVKSVFPDRAREDGRYYAVDFTLGEIKMLSVQERINLKTGEAVFSGRFPLGRSRFEVPTFIEYIELVQGLNKSTGKKIGIIPEIKAPEFHAKENKDIVSKTLYVLKSYGYEENGQAIIQCFEPNTLKMIKNKTKIPLLQLIAVNEWNESSADYDKMLTDDGLKDIASYAQYLGPYLPQLYDIKNDRAFKNEVMTMAHKYELKVAPYTIRDDAIFKPFKNKKEMMGFVLDELKVDGLFSDFADRL